MMFSFKVVMGFEFPLLLALFTEVSSINYNMTLTTIVRGCLVGGLGMELDFFRYQVAIPYVWLDF